MSDIKKRICFIFSVLIGVHTLFGAVVYVSGSGSQTAPYDTWAKAARDINVAVEAAQDGDEILVDDGRYVLDQTVNLEKGVRVTSRNGAQATEVNGDNAVRCFQVRHSGAVLDGFKIAGGRAERGGGVLVTNGLVSNCMIVSNYASLFGGGVDIQYDGVVSDCVISYNNVPVFPSGSGGGACVSDGGRLQASTLSYNQANAGAGVYMFENTVVEACAILYNQALGGMAGPGSGGGVECNGVNTRVMNCMIGNNASQETGGGVYLSGHSGQKVVGCLIYNNETTCFGGGVYANLAPDAYAIENCTITGNRATDEWWGMGGGVCSGSGQAISFRNSIIVTNTAAYQGDNYHSVDDGSVSGVHNCTTPMLNGTGNITADPAFETGGYRLLDESPCKNAGTNQAWMVSAVDLDNKARIIDGIVDMGAYEYGVSPGAIELRILEPNEGRAYESPAEISCDMRAEQFGGPGITQTVVSANGVVLDRQEWDREEYCMIRFTWTNSVAGTYTVRLSAWDANGGSESMSVNIVVTGDPVSEGIILRVLSPYEGWEYELPAEINCDMRAEQFGGPGITQTVVSANGVVLDRQEWDSEEYCMIGFTWTNSVSGNYAVTLSAWDASGYTASTTVNVRVTSSAAVRNDYDGDGKSDIAVFGLWGDSWRWFVRPVHGDPFAIEDWGFPGAVPVPGDYDGDGQADLSVYDSAVGVWYIRPAHGDVFAIEQWGGFNGAVPVSGDFSGDGCSDLAVFDSNTGVWYIRPVHGEPFAIEQWGFQGATPVPADYNGNGRTDLAVYGADGQWYIRSVHGSEIATVQQWGFPGAVPVPGDYDGDGCADLAVYGTDGQKWYWYIRDVAGDQFNTVQEWGFPGAIPVPGDYTGDGKTDLAVYDPVNSVWYIRPVDGEVFAVEAWGWPGAIPVGGR